jgi:iron complex transport system substrate-binding protein
MLFQVAALVDRADEGLALIESMRTGLLQIGAQVRELEAQGRRRPRVFFEEWDEPHISAIRWVSELLGIAGGLDCFPELAAMPMGRDRIIAHGEEIVRRDPDIIIGSWCGKKFRADRVAARAGWSEVAAVRTGQLFEIKSADILQPGPAALTDGVTQMHRIVADWMRAHG